jgi:transcription elongation factor GreA
MMGAFTQEALDRLNGEIESARSTLAEAKLRMGSSGGESNSWHDNAAFDQAKEDVRGAQSHLDRLLGLRVGAYVVEKTDSGAVEVGSLVTIKYDDGDIETMMVAGEHAVGNTRNAQDVDHISTNSPLGAALMGHEAGETIAYAAPSGEITVTIEAVV